MHKEIDKDIVAKSEELHPESHNYYDAKGFCLECENSKEYCECLQFNKYMRTAYQQGAMDERYSDKWISRDERLPTGKDTDIWEEVWALVHNKVSQIPYSVFNSFKMYTHWQPITKPQPPKI